MTKGVLVIAMVIYHSFNYSRNYSLGFKYLPFLPLSFILITGFLIARLYFRPRVADLGTHSRLLLRGVRLLGLFTLLNVAAQLAGRPKLGDGPQGLGYFFDHWFEVYVTGEGRLAAFSILLPIAYLLLLAPALILLDRLHGLLVPVLAIALAGGCAFLAARGEVSANLGLVSAGFVGLLFGRVSENSLNCLGRYWYLALSAYPAFIVVSRFVGQTVFHQLVDASLALVAIFGVCRAIEFTSFSPRWLITMGKYSLVAYIFQIGLLQVLSRAFGRLEPEAPIFFLQMFGVFLLMILITEGLEWARKKSRLVDASYRVVFA